MDTSIAQKALGHLKFEKSTLLNGSFRLLAYQPEFQVEIIPEESVSFFLQEVTPEVFSVVDSYVQDVPKSLRLLTKSAFFLASNPNTPFQAFLSNHVILTAKTIQPQGGAIVYLRISESKNQ